MSKTAGELVERVRRWAAERVCPHCGHDVCGSEPGYLRCSACVKRSRESQWVARSPDTLALCTRLEAAEAEVAHLREEVARLRLERAAGEDVTDEEDAATCAALGGAIGGAFVGEEIDWEAFINALPDPVGAAERVTGLIWGPSVMWPRDWVLGQDLARSSPDTDWSVFASEDASADEVATGAGEDRPAASRALLLAIAAGRVTLPTGASGLVALLGES